MPGFHCVLQIVSFSFRSAPSAASAQVLTLSWKGNQIIFLEYCFYLASCRAHQHRPEVPLLVPPRPHKDYPHDQQQPERRCHLEGGQPSPANADEQATHLQNSHLKKYSDKYTVFLQGKSACCCSFFKTIPPAAPQVGKKPFFPFFSLLKPRL